MSFLFQGGLFQVPACEVWSIKFQSCRKLRFPSVSLLKKFDSCVFRHTVDGNQKSGKLTSWEIGRDKLPLFTGFFYCPGGFLSGCLDHQQYVLFTLHLDIQCILRFVLMSQLGFNAFRQLLKGSAGSSKESCIASNFNNYFYSQSTRSLLQKWCRKEGSLYYAPVN